MKCIGILGGTFDPIHIGHLMMAEEAAAALDLDRVFFIPNRQPPHKDEEGVTPPDDRYLMTLKATAGNELFHVSRIELEREGPSFTIDTVLDIKEKIQDGSELNISEKTKIFLIIGMDSLLDLKNWKDPQKLVSEVILAVAPRPGCSNDSIPGWLLEKTVFLPMPAIDLSSSRIRQRVRCGKPIRYLVPPSVEEYIKTKGLYRPASE